MGRQLHFNLLKPCPMPGHPTAQAEELLEPECRSHHSTTEQDMPKCETGDCST